MSAPEFALGHSLTRASHKQPRPPSVDFSRSFPSPSIDFFRTCDHVLSILDLESGSKPVSILMQEINASHLPVNELYLSASETAAQLEVSLPSLYAYVSRGLIRSQAVAGSKRRLYWRADVDKLRPADKSIALENGFPSRLVSSTRITLLTPGGHYYRGHSALSLAENGTLESVALLLWECTDDAIFQKRIQASVAASAEGPLSTQTTWQRIMTLLFSIEQADARAYDLTRDGYRRSGAAALRSVAAECLGLRTPGTGAIHDLISDTLRVSDGLRDAIRRYLVLAADHELDPTTYSVRAAANTGVTPYAAIAAGFLTCSGRRLVFGQSASVFRFLEELDQAADSREQLLQRIRAGEILPGFGSRAYPLGDPRASAMLHLLRQCCRDDAGFQRLESAIETVLNATGALPSFVLPALFLERKIGMRVEQTTLLRLARVVGWVAHAMEQYFDGDLVRPHAEYAGALPAP